MAEDTYRVTIVKYGTRTTVKSDVFLNFHIYDLADEPIEMDYYFWVVQNSERTVVVDTGFSKHGGEVRKRTFLVEPAAAFASLGVHPDQSPTVVVTHAHYDHIGNLALFPTSPLIMSRTEYDFWASDFRTRAQYAHSVETDELEHLRKASDAGLVETFDGSYDLAPGIRLVEVGGHTPGQVVVSVATDEGTVLLASDAIHFYEEYDDDLPFMFVSDLRAMYAGFDTIHAMVASGEVDHVVSGHDHDVLPRFTPVTEGALAGLAATIGHLDGTGSGPASGRATGTETTTEPQKIEENA